MAKLNNSVLAIKTALREAEITLSDKRPPKKAIKYLLQLFENLDDKRVQGMVHYPLDYIVTLAFLAVLGDANTWQEIHDFCNDNQRWLSKYLPIKEYGIPSHDTFNRVFDLIKTEQLQCMIVNIVINNINCLKKKLGIKPSKDEMKLLSIDGKHEKSSGRKNIVKRGIGVANMQTLHVYDSSNQICLASEPINAKTNEIPIAQNILMTMDLSNTLCSFDALHTQTKTVEIIRNNNGHYIGAIKANHQTIYNVVVQSFPEELLEKMSDSRATKKPIYIYKEEDSHSQFNMREFFMVKAPKNEQTIEWSGIKTFIMCPKINVKKSLKEEMTLEEIREGISSGTRYFISDLDDLNLISEAIRRHWGIEEFHWQLDTTFEQDDNRTMKHNALNNLNLLKNLTLHLCQLMKTVDKYASIRRLRKRYAWNFEENLKQLLMLFDTDAIIQAINSCN